jgi:hypothetical protein
MKVLFIYFVLTILLVNNYNSSSYLGNKQTENCVACKFIWKNIEEALSDNSSSFLSEDKRNPILTAQSFQYFCRIAPDIFFEPCNLMFEKLFFMTQDFCSKKEIQQICIDNEMCSQNALISNKP